MGVEAGEHLGLLDQQSTIMGRLKALLRRSIPAKSLQLLNGSRALPFGLHLSLMGFIPLFLHYSPRTVNQHHSISGDTSATAERYGRVRVILFTLAAFAEQITPRARVSTQGMGSRLRVSLERPWIE